MTGRFSMGNVTEQMYDSIIRRRQAVEFEKTLLFKLLEERDRMQMHRDEMRYKWAALRSRGGSSYYRRPSSSDNYYTRNNYGTRFLKRPKNPGAEPPKPVSKPVSKEAKEEPSVQVLWPDKKKIARNKRMVDSMFAADYMSNVLGNDVTDYTPPKKLTGAAKRLADRQARKNVQTSTSWE